MNEFKKQIKQILDVVTEKTALSHIPEGEEPMVEAKRSQLENALMKVVDNSREEIFPLPKGHIIQNNTTGNRDRIVLELKDWLPFINKLRKWFGLNHMEFKMDKKDKIHTIANAIAQREAGCDFHDLPLGKRNSVYTRAEEEFEDLMRADADAIRKEVNVK